jgi:hypothetical protein
VSTFVAFAKRPKPRGIVADFKPGHHRVCLLLDARCRALIFCGLQAGLSSEGIMTLRLTPLRLAAGAVAAAIVSLMASSAGAFSLETIGGDGSGGSRFSGPDTLTNSQGVRPFGSGGPTMQFGVQPGVQSPFSHGPASAFGSSSLSSQPPPQPYNLNDPSRY